jgi:transcriptional regulator with XRE-family HTH domain
MSLTSIDLGLREILADPVRRQEFFRTITQDDIAEQIRALRIERGLTQTKFAELAGMKQSAVSRIEQAEYASWALATLFRAAGALNARWRMILEPCEDAVKEFLDIQDGEDRTDAGSAPDPSTHGTATVNASAGSSSQIYEMGLNYETETGVAAEIQIWLRGFDIPIAPALVIVPGLSSVPESDQTASQRFMSLAAAVVIRPEDHHA